VARRESEQGEVESLRGERAEDEQGEMRERSREGVRMSGPQTPLLR
jgi:hypothetical protein